MRFWSCILAIRKAVQAAFVRVDDLYNLDYAVRIMKVRFGRLLVFATTATFAAQAWAVSPEQKASELRDRYSRNFSKIRTIEFSQGTSSNERAVAVRGTPRAQERVAWNREQKKLRWSHPDTDRVRIVDGKAEMMAEFSGGTTVFVGSLQTTGSPPELLVIPFPAWLWNPDWLTSGELSSVRVENGALVLVVGTEHPLREIWLEEGSGLLRRFTETSPTGRIMRVVVCRNWVERDGVWLPSTIDEELIGTKRTAHRTIELRVDSVNRMLPEDIFAIPR